MLFMTRDLGEPPTWPVAVAATRNRSLHLFGRNHDSALSSENAPAKRILRHDSLLERVLWSATRL